MAHLGFKTFLSYCIEDYNVQALSLSVTIFDGFSPLRKMPFLLFFGTALLTSRNASFSDDYISHCVLRIIHPLMSE